MINRIDGFVSVNSSETGYGYHHRVVCRQNNPNCCHVETFKNEMAIRRLPDNMGSKKGTRANMCTNSFKHHLEFE
jgi:hypothetical protein